MHILYTGLTLHGLISHKLAFTSPEILPLTEFPHPAGFLSLFNVIGQSEKKGIQVDCLFLYITDASFVLN